MPEEAKADDFESLGFDPTTFATLEADFESVLGELQDPTLERFKEEYSTLHRALKKSHESEKRLLKKCRELSSDITATSTKVATAVRLSGEDQNIVAQLKKDIEKVWSGVEQSHEKEAQAKDTLASLRTDIEQLRLSIDQGAGSSIVIENRVRELAAERDELQRERDSHAQQVQQARGEIVEITERLKMLEAEKVVADQAVADITQQIDQKHAETEREKRRKERLEKELKELKEVLEKRHGVIKEKQARVTVGLEETGKLEHQLREQKHHTDRTLKEVDGLTQKVSKLQIELEDQVALNAQIVSDNVRRLNEIRQKEGEIAGVSKEIVRMEKLRDVLLKKIVVIEAQHKEVDKERDQLKLEVIAEEAQIEVERKEREAESKQIDELVRERDILNKNLVKMGGSTAQVADLLKINENTKRNLEVEIAGYRTAASAQTASIKRLTGEKARYVAEHIEAQSKFSQAVDEVKAREITVLQLQKKIAEGESKLKQQQNLYEAVRSDRNLYSKNLIESQEEIAEMKRKFKIMTRQIEQLKEEIQAKDQGLVKEHFEHMKVDKEKEQLRDGLQAVQKSLGKAEADEGQFKAEVSKLNVIINEADTERLKQQKEYETVCNERDILGMQLIKRNDELAQLYEKIKIQQTTLNAGEGAYVERTADIAALQMDIATLRSEQGMLKASVANMDMLKHEVHQLERELLQERTKVRALSEELETQMNVHRWRKLEGSDPSTYSMIQRSHALQKQLIRKTEEVATKDALIQQKEKLYVELKAILARQPGPEVAEQLQIYQENLGEKQKQLKAMTAELNMHRSQVSDLKLDQEHLVQLLTQLKKKYFEQKQLERRQRAMGAHYGGGPTGGFDGMGEYDGGEYFGDGGEIEGLGDAGEMEGTLAPTQAFGDGGAPAHDAPPPEDGGEAQ